MPKLVLSCVVDGEYSFLISCNSFAHIDLNNAEPESFCLEYLTPRMSKGGCIVLDDYGWWGYSEQKVALDEIANKYNLDILELPTGQGVIFF